MSFQIGEIVGPYKIIGPIGSGGAGEVFKAEHIITKRLEAIKVLAVSGPGGEEQAQRFLREVQIQASLSHPNIAAVHTAFWANGAMVMAMELVDGEPLKRLLERGRIPLVTTLDYSLQALSALEYAHAHHVTHRDITPANLLVTADGIVKVTDFGLAKSPTDLRLTQTGTLVGSVYYMSPEQVRASPDLDQRTDIYSMGAVLYEMVAGVKPFDGDNAFSIMNAHVSEEPRPPVDTSPALRDVILKALAKDPSDRFQSAGEFHAALSAVEHQPAQRNNTPRIALATGIAVLVAAALLLAPKSAPTAVPSVVETPPVASKPQPRQLSFRKTVTIKAGAAVWAIALSGSGKLLAAGTEDRTIEIWDPATGARRTTLHGHGAGVSAVSFSHDENLIASGSADSTVKLWDLRSHAERGVFRHGDLVTAVALSADGRWLASGSSNKNIKIWNLKDGGRMNGFKAKSEPRALIFSPDARLMTIAGEDGLMSYRPGAARELQSWGKPSGIAAFAYTSEGQCLLLNANKKGVKLWDAVRSKELATIEPAGVIRALAVSKNGRLIATGDESGTISVWTANEPE